MILFTHWSYLVGSKIHVNLFCAILSTIMSLAFKVSLLCVILFVSFKFNMVLCIELEEYYPEERDALMLIRDSLNSSVNLHGNWTGPPCIDNRSRWIGITCSNWHVVQIVLEGDGAGGSIGHNLCNGSPQRSELLPYALSGNLCST